DVNTYDDLLTKPPNPLWETIESSGHFVSESFYKFIGPRTTDIRHLTALAVVDFFTVPMTAQTLAAANSPRQTRLHSKRSGPDRKSKHPSSPARSLSAAPTHPLLCRWFDRTSSAQATLAGGPCRPGTERTGRTIHLEKTRRRV